MLGKRRKTIVNRYIFFFFLYNSAFATTLRHPELLKPENAWKWKPFSGFDTSGSQKVIPKADLFKN